MPVRSKFNVLQKETTKFRFTVSSIQSKITGRVKMQKNVIHNKDKTQSIKAEPKMTKIFAPTGKHFKNAIIGAPGGSVS